MSGTSRAVLAIHDALERGRTTALEFALLRVFAAGHRIPYAGLRLALARGQEKLAAGVPYDEVYRSVLAVMSPR